MSNGRDLLVRQRDRIQTLKEKPHGNPEYTVWLAQTEGIVQDVFGKGSHQFEQFESIFRGPFFISTSTPDSVFQRDYEDDLEKGRLLLDSFLEDMSAVETQRKKYVACPNCGSDDVEYLTIRDTEKRGFWGSVKVFGGKKETVKSSAFYKCRACDKVFPMETK